VSDALDQIQAAIGFDSPDVANSSSHGHSACQTPREHATVRVRWDDGARLDAG